MNAFTVQDAPLNMAPTGIATFAKVPICYDIRTSEHRSMYSYVRLSIDRCTATYV